MPREAEPMTQVNRYPAMRAATTVAAIAGSLFAHVADASRPDRADAALAQSSSPTPSSAVPGSRQAGRVTDVPASSRAGVIRGRILRSDTGMPLRNVRMTLRAEGLRDLPDAITGDDGRFELAGLPAREYRLFAWRPEFVMSLEDRGPGRDPMDQTGRLVIAGEDQAVEDVEMTLLPGAVMAGQVIDVTGEPLAGALVQASPEQFHEGRSWPHPSVVAFDLTDDHGRFRLFGLPPGGYFLSARATAGQLSPMSWPSPTIADVTYYPGSTVGSEGRVLYLLAGEEIGGLSFGIVPPASPMPPAAAQATIGARIDAPPPVFEPATIRGRVTRQEDGAMLSRVEISARPSGSGIPRSAWTDVNGRFELTGLAPGRYTIHGSKTGYVALQYGQRHPGQLPETIPAAEGETVEDIELALPGGAAMSGRVVDARGEPVAGAIIQALRQQWVRGRQQLIAAPAAPDRTDDRGAFRIHGLAPGSYLLSAGTSTAEAARAVAMVTSASFVTFYPGTLSAVEAQPLVLSSSQDLSGLVITTSPARRVTISGVVQTAVGTPYSPATVALAQRLPFSVSGSASRTTTVRADGTFLLPGVPPGEYTVSARGTSPNDLVALAHIVVTDSDVEVPLVVRRGDRMKGRITFESDAERTPLSPAVVRILLEAAEPGQVVSVVLDGTPPADWTFDIGGLIGRRHVRVVLPQGWAVKAVRVGNTDITDMPLDFTGVDLDGVEIALTTLVTEVSGRAVDARGEAVPGAVVVLFAEDRARRGPDSRFIAVMRADRLGRFEQRGLPPERYLAAALFDLESGEETNPQVLERLHDIAVTRFTLGDGESRELDVRLVDVR